MDTPIRRRSRRAGTSHATWAASTHTIVGVLPLGFRGLSGDAELWTPLAVTDPESLTEAHSHSYSVIARRKPEVAEAAVVSALGVYGTTG